MGDTNLLQILSLQAEVVEIKDAQQNFKLVRNSVMDLVDKTEDLGKQSSIKLFAIY